MNSNEQPSSNTPTYGVDHDETMDHTFVEPAEHIAIPFGPDVQAMPVATELAPPEWMYKAIPTLDQDFFRSPIPDQERKRMLASCPRNTDMVYEPPLVNDMQSSAESKRTDSQLSDIQFRLSGITRPLDAITYQWNHRGTDVPLSEVNFFVNQLRALLSDAASHCTQLRTDNMFRASGIAVQAPKPADSERGHLMEPKELVEHIQAAKAFRNATQPRRQPKKRNGQAYRPHLFQSQPVAPPPPQSYPQQPYQQQSAQQTQPQQQSQAQYGQPVFQFNSMGYRGRGRGRGRGQRQSHQ